MAARDNSGLAQPSLLSLGRPQGRRSQPPVWSKPAVWAAEAVTTERGEQEADPRTSINLRWQTSTKLYEALQGAPRDDLSLSPDLQPLPQADDAMASASLT